MARTRLTAAIVALSLVGAAHADTTTLTVDSSQSMIDLDLTINLAVLGSDSASDSSPITGEVEIELDDYGTPTSITIHDFALAMQDNLSFHFEWFLSEIDAAGSGLGAVYETPGTPTGPVPVSAGAFSFGSVLTALSGTLTANGSVIGAGDINETVVLDDQPPYAAPISGMVTSDGTTVTINGGMITFSGSTELIAGVATLDVVGTVTFVASGPAPQPAGCNAADLAEPYDQLDFSDVVSFLTAFGTMAPEADIAAPFGQWDFSDVVEFLTAFGMGCP
ncbi:MAG: GC-type dockerin domain-anchored protein [Phycisphaerales bacterium]